MELKEYHYVYYSYEEYGRGYFGSRTCRCLPEEDIKYFGSFSDKNFKPTQKIILKSDYATREEAYADEIILHEYYKVIENPHFANRAYQTSTKFYIPKEKAIEVGKKLYDEKKGIFSLTTEEKSKHSGKIGKKCYKNKTGMFAITPEERIEMSRKIGQKSYENGTGIFSLTLEEKIELGRRVGRQHYMNGTGIFSMSPEEKSEHGKRICKEGKGCFSLTTEERSQTSRKVASQRWKCLETGFITNAGNLTKYQRKRGIDTSKRVRIS